MTPRRVYSIRVKTGEYLKAHGLTATDLIRRSEGRLSRNSIYRLARARDRQDRIDLTSLEVFAELLSEATGETVRMQDLFQLSSRTIK